MHLIGKIVNESFVILPEGLVSRWFNENEGGSTNTWNHQFNTERLLQVEVNEHGFISLKTRSLDNNDNDSIERWEEFQKYELNSRLLSNIGWERIGWFIQFNIIKIKNIGLNIWVCSHDNDASYPSAPVEKVIKEDFITTGEGKPRWLEKDYWRLKGFTGEQASGGRDSDYIQHQCWRCYDIRFQEKRDCREGNESSMWDGVSRQTVHLWLYHAGVNRTTCWRHWGFPRCFIVKILIKTIDICVGSILVYVRNKHIKGGALASTNRPCEEIRQAIPTRWNMGCRWWRSRG